MNEFEQRTATFFRNSYELLAEQLKGRVIQLQGSQKRILIPESGVQAFAKVGPRWQAIENMRPGDLWTYPFRVRRMRQSLIVAYNPQEVASCVRLVRASGYDLAKNEFVPMPHEGDIANYFELADNEISTLKFLDESETLYLVRSNHFSSQSNAEVNSLSPTEANSQFRNLLESG